MEMNSVQALTKLVRSLTNEDLTKADDDDIAALCMQIPRLGRRLQKVLEERGLMEAAPQQPLSLADLMGGQ
jgi:hypothetical protein